MVAVSAHELALWREQFPVTQDHIYLDIANKCPLPRCVVEAWMTFLDDMHAGPGHKDTWKRKGEELRMRIATFLGTSPGEIAFVKNTSEGLNTLASAINYEPGTNVVVHALEHPNNLYTFLNLRARGIEVRVVPSHDGDLYLEDIIAQIDGATRVVAISAVSYCTGKRIDILTLSEACHRRGALLVVDAVQAIGVVDFRVKELGIDALACGPQKGLLCPHGLAFIYCREDLIPSLTPVFAARSSLASFDTNRPALHFLADARRFEHGNINYGGAYALDAAIALIESIGIARIEARIRELTTLLIESLADRDISVLTPCAAADRAGIVVFRVPDVQRVHADLCSRGIVLSIINGMLRAAPHWYNTEDELDALVRALCEVSRTS